MNRYTTTVAINMINSVLKLAKPFIQKMLSFFGIQIPNVLASWPETNKSLQKLLQMEIRCCHWNYLPIWKIFQEYRLVS